MYSSTAQTDTQHNEYLVLVIEDDELDYVILERLLRGEEMFKLVWTRSMREGIAELSKRRFDVTLLDLSLPDSKGLSTVEAFTARTTTPVVVVSGLDDESTALKAVQHGAQDYLVKGQFSRTLICRTLRYAVERYRLLEELHLSRELVQRERELRRLEADTALLRSSVSNHVQATEPLRKSHPQIHHYAIEQYSMLLDKALEKRGFKVKFNVSAQIRELATALGRYQATPRDIVEIHTLSVDDGDSTMPANKRQLRNEEARFLLTGMLGHLCSYYLSMQPTSAPDTALDNVEMTTTRQIETNET